MQGCKVRGYSSKPTGVLGKKVWETLAWSITTFSADHLMTWGIWLRGGTGGALRVTYNAGIVLTGYERLAVQEGLLNTVRSVIKKLLCSGQNTLPTATTATHTHTHTRSSLLYAHSNCSVYVSVLRNRRMCCSLDIKTNHKSSATSTETQAVP